MIKMSADKTDPIDAAIESAESLISSFLSRERAVSVEDAVDGALLESKAEPNLDPEQSLFSPVVDQSLITEGSAPFFPSPLTAASQATVPASLELVSPKESLHAIVSKVVGTSEYDSLDTYTLQRLLHEREKDLEVAAKIGQALLQRNEALESDLVKAMEHWKLLELQLRQMQHTVSRKEELLRLYATEQDEQSSPIYDTTVANPNWVQVLTEECKELRESNLQLQEEADKLRKETADVETKEKELVQQCLEQFTEAKRRLSDLRMESEQKNEENYNLKDKLVQLDDELLKVHGRWQHQLEESDSLKDQLTISQEQNHHLSQAVAELQDKLDDMAVLLKESKDELAVLKDSCLQNSSPPNDATQVEHESIVQEIEEVLRKEIIAASTLPERPRSPDHYARQRTMVVMETVRAATLASSRRKERLAVKFNKPSQPLASSSPSGKKSAMNSTAEIGVCPPSPILPGQTNSIPQVPEELVRYRNQTYIAPEKLQIVKPLEGSVTLLKWKLLASPQLGGATSFFSSAAGPGVHMKKWRAGGVIDDSPSGLAGSRVKSLSTADLDSLNFSHGGGWRETTTSSLSVSMDTGKEQAVTGKKSATAQRSTINKTVKNVLPLSSTSMMKQMGSYLGLGGHGQQESHNMSTPETGRSTGLSTLLES